jgi:serralysin
MQRIVIGCLMGLGAASLAEAARAGEPPDTQASVALRRFAAASVVWIWPTGSTIEGCFTNGSQEERQLVVDGAKEWMQHANIRFDFGPTPVYRKCPATAPFPPTRVSFGSGNVSHARLGTFGSDRPNDKPTMFIATSNASQKPRPIEHVRATILHEFGHVLGIVHEHQHPESACFHMVAWTQLCAKREATVRLPGYIVTNWLPTIGQVNPDYAAGRPYDPLSIMHYKFPANNFTGPASTCVGPRNFTLSEGDKTKIARLYPKTRAEQQAMITSQGALIARAIVSAGDLDQTAAERMAREGERLVHNAFVDMQQFRIDVSAGVAELRPGRGDKGGVALASFGRGAAEAAVVACGKAEAPVSPNGALQIRRGDH